MGKLNKTYALSCKGILDFGGLALNGNELHFSDIDGIHSDRQTKILIEEKYHWNCYETEAFYLTLEIENDKRPAILLLTKNPKDISNLPYEEKIIEMKESIVLKTYDNTNGKFADFLKSQRLNLETLYLRNCNINHFINCWYQYLDSLK